MLRRVLWSSLVSVILLFALVVAGIGWVGSERALHPRYYHYRWSLKSFPELRFEPIQVQSSTGVRLSGRFFPGRSKALIVLASGYGDTQQQMLPFADFLHRAGFGVITFNSRARLDSGGQFVTLGFYEQYDLISVIRYAASRPDVDPRRIGALGVSMGGSNVILAAAQEPKVRAVVDDCGFSDAPRVIAASFEHFIHLPAFPFAPVTVWLASWRAGIDVNAVRPVDVIGRISPRPILIIHGAADRIVPVENSQRNFTAAKEPKQLWLVPDAGHGQSHTVEQKLYESRVIQFFQNSLQ